MLQRGSHWSCLVHGDDFITLLSRSGAQKFATDMSKHLMVKVRVVIGFRPGDAHDIRILNRLVTFIPAEGAEPDQIHWEGDPRHIDLLMQQFGLTNSSKAAVAPHGEG